MEISSITNWLKTSLGGVIVLGALGSLLAILLLRFGKFLLVSVGLKVLAKRAFVQGWNAYAICSYLEAKKDPALAGYFILYLMARFIIAVFASLVLLIVFWSLVPISVHLLRPTTFVVVTLFFVSLYWIYEEFRNIWFIYEKQVYRKAMGLPESGKSKQEPSQPRKE